MTLFILRELTDNRLGVNGNPLIKFAGSFPEVKRSGLFVGATLYLRLSSVSAQVCRAMMFNFSNDYDNCRLVAVELLIILIIQSTL